jgi:hypothetical protein
MSHRPPAGLSSTSSWNFKIMVGTPKTDHKALPGWSLPALCPPARLAWGPISLHLHSLPVVHCLGRSWGTHSSAQCTPSFLSSVPHTAHLGAIRDPSSPVLTQGSLCICLCGFFGFLVVWGLNSGLCACRAGVLPLEPCPQPFLLWLF